MDAPGTSELLAYRLVGRELTPDSTVIEVRGGRIGDGFFGPIAAARFADEFRTLVALTGKTVG